MDIFIFCICWDIGGIDVEIVYKCLKKYGIFCVLFVKGVFVYGKFVIIMFKKCNQSGVFLCEIGIDIVKEMFYVRMGVVIVFVDEVMFYVICFLDNLDVFMEVEVK